MFSYVRRLLVQPPERRMFSYMRPLLMQPPGRGMFPYMRRLLMQPPIEENLFPEWPMSRARFARHAAVADP
jgi:hypothetical protein